MTWFSVAICPLSAILTINTTVFTIYSFWLNVFVCSVILNSIDGTPHYIHLFANGSSTFIGVVLTLLKYIREHFDEFNVFISFHSKREREREETEEYGANTIHIEHFHRQW